GDGQTDRQNTRALVRADRRRAIGWIGNRDDRRNRGRRVPCLQVRVAVAEGTAVFMTTVLFVGDSITVGLVGVAAGLTNGSSFRGPASRALGWRGVGPFADRNGLLHGGVGGSTTQTFLSGKAEWVVAPDGVSTWMNLFHPDVVHLML